MAGNKLAMELGHIAEYHIYSSDLPESGDFNLLLVVVYSSDADLAPSKARYEAFVKAWGKANEERNKEISQTYPDVRTIPGEYRMREILMK